MFCTKRPILGHVTPRLAHKPDRSTVNRFPSAGF
jgi:hypothetical protein